MSWTAEKILAGCIVSMGHFQIMGHLRISQKTGDVILWVYTCDLGNDVGNPYQGDEK